MSPDIAAAFRTMPAPARDGCLGLRSLIFDVALATPGVGRVAEELRWGQPAYLTPDTKSGSTLRLGTPKSGGYALFVNCRTTLIADFQTIAGPGWRYEGTRAVLFRDGEEPDREALRLLIRAALTYHLR
jgi:hypothetical protein